MNCEKLLKWVQALQEAQDKLLILEYKIITKRNPELNEIDNEDSINIAKEHISKVLGAMRRELNK